MPLFVDARIPVLFGIPPSAGDAVLLPGGEWTMDHPTGCACCVVRGPAAASFDRLFLDRVKGVVPWFTRVVAPEDPGGLIRAALDDAVVAARFRAG